MIRAVATYVIGDVQGCFDELQALLDRAEFSPGRDRVWLVGDLVNRGPRSASVLRWAVRHDPCVVAVLGNHDLHLIARALGTTTAKRRDTLDDVLDAADRDELVEWLRRRPLAHLDRGHLLVHAGLHPTWTTTDALAYAAEAEAALRGAGAGELIAAARSLGPVTWNRSLRGTRRLAAVIQTLTTLRTVSPAGTPCDFSGPPSEAPEGCRPWFECRPSSAGEPTVLFGHWAALGLHLGPHAIGLDTGCVWGGALTALRLEDGALFREPARGAHGD